MDEKLMQAINELNSKAQALKPVGVKQFIPGRWYKWFKHPDDPDSAKYIRYLQEDEDDPDNIMYSEIVSVSGRHQVYEEDPDPDEDNKIERSDFELVEDSEVNALRKTWVDKSRREVKSFKKGRWYKWYNYQQSKSDGLKYIRVRDDQEFSDESIESLEYMAIIQVDGELVVKVDDCDWHEFELVDDAEVTPYLMKNFVSQTPKGFVSRPEDPKPELTKNDFEAIKVKLMQDHAARIQDEVMKKNPSSPRPEVGDWVTITKSDKSFNHMMEKYVGLTLKIEAIANNEDATFSDPPEGIRAWHWRWSNDHYRFATSNEIMSKLAMKIMSEDTAAAGFYSHPEGSPAFPVHKFEKGDVVKVTDDVKKLLDFGIGKSCAGKVGIIQVVEMHNDGPHYRIAIDNVTWMFKDEHLSKGPKYKEGDFVIITHDKKSLDNYGVDESCAGKVGKVSTVDQEISGGYKYVVTVEGSKTWWYKENHLIELPPLPISEIPLNSALVMGNSIGAHSIGYGSNNNIAIGVSSRGYDVGSYGSIGHPGTPGIPGKIPAKLIGTDKEGKRVEVEADSEAEVRLQAAEKGYEVDYVIVG